MEFSNPAYLEELEKRMILKKKIVQIGPSVQVLQNLPQKYFIYFCRKMVVFVVLLLLLLLFVANLSDFDILFLKIEALDKLRKILSGKKLFGAFPTWQGPWIRKLYSNSADLQRANF